MNSVKKIVIQIVVFIIALSLSFIFGYCFRGKNTKDSQIKLEQDLERMKEVVSNLNERNEELIKLNDEQSKLCDKLKNEKNEMQENLDGIKKATISTKSKIDELNDKATDASSTIRVLKENQKILREYINEVSKVTGEFK